MNEDSGGRRSGRLAAGALLPAALARTARARTVPANADQMRMRSFRAAAAAALALTAVLATACSGSHTTGSGASPAPGNVQQLDAFAACMRGHGVLNFYLSNTPHTSNTSTELSIMGHYVPGVNPQTAQFGTAMKACKHLLPHFGGQMTRQQISSLLKSAACMRAHGFPDYPDPVVQNGRVAEKPLPSDIDTSSAQFQQAQQACNAS
jgi:hypothetical protein